MKVGFAFCILLLAVDLSACEKLCNPTNQRASSEALPYFNSQIEENYVGQYKAVRDASHEIQSLLNYFAMTQQKKKNVDGFDTGFKLHFVGPSGTGKSFLAEIISKSFFKPIQCAPLSFDLRSPTVQTGLGASAGAIALANSLLVLNPVTLAATAAMASVGVGLGYLYSEELCLDKVQLDSWLLTCGVFHHSFNAIDQKENAKSLNDLLLNLATFLTQHYNIPKSERTMKAMVILDDFNLCSHECQKVENLRFLINQDYLVLNSQKVFAKNVGIIFTSDLTNMGLTLEKGEDYHDSLQKVQKTAKEFWKQNLIVENMKLMPFAPLSDMEISKIIQKVLDMTRHSIINRIHLEMDLLTAASDLKHSYTGRVVFSEPVTMSIIDTMEESIRAKNSRAVVEELKAMLRNIMKQPEAIEKRLSKKHPTACPLNQNWKEWVLNKKSAAVCYYNDIVLNVVENRRPFLAFDIED